MLALAATPVAGAQEFAEEWEGTPFAAFAAESARTLAAGQLDRLSWRLAERRAQPDAPIFDLRSLNLMAEEEEVSLGPEEGVPQHRAALFASGTGLLEGEGLRSDGVTAGLDWSVAPGVTFGISGGWSFRPGDWAEDGLQMSGRALSLHGGIALAGLDLHLLAGGGQGSVTDPWDPDSRARAQLRFAELGAQRDLILAAGPGLPTLTLTPRLLLAWTRAEATDSWGDRGGAEAADALAGATLRLDQATGLGDLSLYLDGAASADLAGRRGGAGEVVGQLSERLRPALRGGIALYLPTGGMVELTSGVQRVARGPDAHELRLDVYLGF